MLNREVVLEFFQWLLHGKTDQRQPLYIPVENTIQKERHYQQSLREEERRARQYR